MKKLFIFAAALLLLLASCTNINSKEGLDCKGGEIIDGKCILSKDKNVNLFTQDLSSVKTEEAEHGFLAEPISDGKYPGIIMIHEWWGLNDNIKQMAKILAKEGYAVYAVDLYDGQVATDSETAGKLASEVRANPDKAIKTMKEALKFLSVRDNINLKFASLGWCFGGGQSLQLAINEDLDAAVIYYGQLTNDTNKLSMMESPVLGIFGEEDRSIPVASVREFETNLNALNIENDIYIYPEVGHAFANPTGANYGAEQTIDAWGKTVEFLNKNLKE